MSQNILLVIFDQLSAQALPSFGGWVNSAPQIESLAKNGLCFNRAYSNYPLCMPSRASFWSGRYPHQTGVISNGRLHQNSEVGLETPTIGQLLSEAGLDCVHFGKEHDAGALHGFRRVQTDKVKLPSESGFPLNGDSYKDEATTRAVCSWLDDGVEGPFCCAVDIQNPHNICGWVGENRQGVDPSPVPEPLPELPVNLWDFDLENRPKPVQYICCAHNRQGQSSHWDDEAWRRYRAAYEYYIGLADAHLARILDALKKNGKYDDTLIVLMADHGDGMGHHGHATKHTSFYDQTTRIPLIVHGKGVDRKGACDDLVSLVDLLPTLVDVAGGELPEGLPGHSLLPAWREGADVGHGEVVSQWHTEWGFTVEPGRMLRTDRFKYCVYREEDGEELYDMEQDPWEQRNLASDSNYQDVLENHRQTFKAYLEKSGDDFLSLDWKADPRWREHAVGYSHHHGPAAPEAGS